MMTPERPEKPTMADLSSEKRDRNSENTDKSPATPNTKDNTLLRDDEKEPHVNENVDETMENLEKAFGDFKEDAMSLMDTVAAKQTTAVMDRDEDEMLGSDEEQHSPKALANKLDQVHTKGHEDASQQRPLYQEGHPEPQRLSGF
jgi:hypothetical protein